MMNLNFNNPNREVIERRVRLKSKARQMQHEAEMELLMVLFDIDSLEDDEEEGGEEEIEVNKEDVEIELMLIDDFRDVELDMNQDEMQWINDNVNLSKLLGTNEPTVQALCNKLEMSEAKIILLVRRCLGYKAETTYQRDQKEYICELRKCFRKNLYEELDKRLKKESVYEFYQALLDYISDNISRDPQGLNEDDLVFYVNYTELRSVCKQHGIQKGLGTRSLREKMAKLCVFKLLTNLKDNQLTDETLEKANEYKESTSNLISESAKQEIEANRSNYYVLNDLSPKNQREALRRLEIIITCGLRGKDRCSTSYAALFGEEIQGEITAQGEHNLNETKVRNFNEAAIILLNKQNYFTEEQLRKQYLKKDHHMKSDESKRVTAIYLSGTANNTNCIKTRVNSRVREEYSLPKKIKSNSFIYVLKNN